MAYIYNKQVSLQENISEIEVYGQLNTKTEEVEIRIYLEDEGLHKEDIEKLIVAYKRGLTQSN